MSVGPKYDDLGLFRVTIVTDAASLSHLDSDEASNTFLVLGPIDLTNGRAGMVSLSYPRCAGQNKDLDVRDLIK
jgi:hypothetical protein